MHRVQLSLRSLPVTLWRKGTGSCSFIAPPCFHPDQGGRISSTSHSDILLLPVRGWSSVSSTFEYIVLKLSFFHSSIRENHSAMAMLDAFYPLSFIHRTVSPEHLSIAVSLIVLIVSLVDVSALPGKHPVPVFLVLLVLPVITVCILGSTLLPLAFPML